MKLASAPSQHHLRVVLLFHGLVAVHQSGDGRAQLQQAKQDEHRVQSVAQNLGGSKPRGVHPATLLHGGASCWGEA